MASYGLLVELRRLGTHTDSGFVEEVGMTDMEHRGPHRENFLSLWRAVIFCRDTAQNHPQLFGAYVRMKFF